MHLKSQVSSQTQPACTHIRECQGLGSGTPRRPAGYMPRAPARPVATAAAAAVPIIHAYAHVYIYARIGVTCENSNSKGHRQEDRTRGNRESHNNLCLLSRGDLRIPILRISHFVTEEPSWSPAPAAISAWFTSARLATPLAQTFA